MTDAFEESKRGYPTLAATFGKLSGLGRLFPHSKSLGGYYCTALDMDGVHQVEVLAGAFMLLRRSALDKTGLLDEDFFMYGEDIDLSCRIEEAGYKIIIYLIRYCIIREKAHRRILIGMCVYFVRLWIFSFVNMENVMVL